MKLSKEQKIENFSKLIDLIDKNISGDRKDSLLDLHNDWMERIWIAPASTKTQYHNAFPGGYVLHVLNVASCALKLSSVWESMGADIDFSREELMFSALTHDLGKIGTETHEYYVPCKEQWMINKGQVYVINPEIQFMKVSERTLMTLANRQIPVSEKEYLAIKLHDGLYEDSNKGYLMSYSEDYELKTILPHIIHQADFISSKVEGKRKKLGVPESVKSESPLKKSESSSLSKFLSE